MTPTGALSVSVPYLRIVNFSKAEEKLLSVMYAKIERVTYILSLHIKVLESGKARYEVQFEVQNFLRHAIMSCERKSKFNQSYFSDGDMTLSQKTLLFLYKKKFLSKRRNRISTMLKLASFLSLSVTLEKFFPGWPSCLTSLFFHNHAPAIIVVILLQ